MTGWQAKLDASRRVVRCHNCGSVLGRIWVDGRERHLLFENTMGLTEAGVWAERRRVRRVRPFGHQPYRAPLPVSRSLSPNSNPFGSIALEPTAYPVRVRCPWCRALQRIDAGAIEVLIPEPGEPPKAFLTWPMDDPFESIGQPDED